MTKLQPIRPRRLALTSLALVALLAACGGEGTGDVTSTSRAATAQSAHSASAEGAPLAASNRILQAAQAVVPVDATATRAYLSWSPQVWRVGAGSDGAGFDIQADLDGYHEIFLWWPQGVADAGEVLVSVQSADGRSSIRLDQRQAGGQWVSLGHHRLAKAQAARIRLQAAGSAPVLVDAVRMQFAGPNLPALRWAAADLPTGLVGSAYDEPLPVTGGRGPYRFAITQGRLPPGLELDGDSGLVRGTPLAAGDFELVLTVTDAAGSVQTLATRLVVDGVGRRRATVQSTSPTRLARPSEVPSSASSGTADLNGLVGLVAGMPEGSWLKANVNSFSDVWTPAALRPLHRTSNPAPSKIISSWSSFTWDTRRGKLFLYGGGHANYRGNDVYMWNGSTRLWERAALPSEMIQDAMGNWVAVDGHDKAPASAHTYDNTMYFSVLDRIVVLGGAADANGGHFLTADSTGTSSRKTGPYLFDPARADGNKVGGSTGSHVQRVAPYPEVTGGNMWNNREAWLHANANSAPSSESFVNSCTGVTEEAGQDVAYIRTPHRVYRYRIHDLGNPAADTWELVGRYYSGSGAQATCTYDHHRRALVTAGRNTKPFLYWNMATAGKSNNEVYVTPVDPSGEFNALLSSNAIDLRYCGIDYDPRRQRHLLWCGDDRIWTLTPPATLSPAGWTIEKAPTVTAGGPSLGTGTGILGKWKYIPNIDAFIGLADAVHGDIWVYKPFGWVNPTGANLPPSVGLTAPAPGTTIPLGQTLTLAAAAADADGSVTQVSFRANGLLVGQVASAPFTVSWTPPAAGTYDLTAIATDDQGAITTSAPVTVLVSNLPPPNQPPTVAITSPATGSSFMAGAPVPLQASAADSDGTIVKVEYFVDGVLVGESTVSPYTVAWSGAAVGSRSLVARATDDDGAWTDSAPVVVTVNPAGGGGAGTVTLQRGLLGSVVADLYLSNYHKTSNFGSTASALDQQLHYSNLLRFAIFQSEGGPVPDGAVIESAVLSLYKSTAYDMRYGLHAMLRPWTEASANWNQSQPGAPWGGAGANLADADYASTPDATGLVGWSPGWLEFDVTARLAALSASASPAAANHGWRLRQISGSLSSLKKFHTSEFADDPTLRPKLVVTYR